MLKSRKTQDLCSRCLLVHASTPTPSRRGTHYTRAKEWKKVLDPCRRVLFRPRLKVAAETLEVTLRFARAAAHGRKGTRWLGRDFSNSLALVGFNTQGRGVVDLILLSPSGCVALGECKRAPVVRPAVTGSAWRQLLRYKEGIRKLTRRDGWLCNRIEANYGKFGFGAFSKRLREIGLRTEEDQRTWWRKVTAALRDGEVHAFVVIGSDGQPPRAVFADRLEVHRYGPGGVTDNRAGAGGWRS